MKATAKIREQERLAKRDSGCMIVVLTASTGLEKQSLEAGANSLLSKPVGLIEFSRMLKAICAADGVRTAVG